MRFICAVVIWGFGSQLLFAVGTAPSQCSDLAMVGGRLSRETQLQPILDRHCTDCHGGKEPDQGLSLESTSPFDKNETILIRIADRVSARQMPPQGFPPLTLCEINTIRQFARLDNLIAGANCESHSDIEHVFPRRLNKNEFNYTVSDLFYGLEVTEGDDFPDDPVVEGFSNNAIALSISAEFLERYLEAAQLIVDRALKSKVRAKIFGCWPKRLTEWDGCAKQILKRHLERALRRPIQYRKIASGRVSEVDEYMRFYEVEKARYQNFELATRNALIASLVTPKFLFRFEHDNPQMRDGEIRKLNDFEVANRLSFFLWSSMPDEELLGLARQGTLNTKENLTRQVNRMVRDPKFDRFVRQFGEQWLKIQSLKSFEADSKIFPNFAKEIIEISRNELFDLLSGFFRENRDVKELLTGSYVWQSPVLQRYYSEQGRSQGLLTHPAVLMVNSHPDKTSPVKRGKWILEQLLCTPPPPPPPNVTTALKEVSTNATLREQLEAHRSNGSCMACHKIMDPIGLSLEHFDATGKWRMNDKGNNIDTSGQLVSGERFKNVQEISSIINMRRDFRSCVRDKLFTYALGRRLSSNDQCIVNSFHKEGNHRVGFKDMLIDVVLSRSFLFRKINHTTPKLNTIREVDHMYSQSIKPIFEKKCGDCHSDAVALPWYLRLPGLARAVKKEKAEAISDFDLRLAFPFGEGRDPVSEIEKIAQVAANHSMPPKAYALAHPNSVLSEGDKREIALWAHESKRIFAEIYEQAIQ